MSRAKPIPIPPEVDRSSPHQPDDCVPGKPQVCPPHGLDLRSASALAKYAEAARREPARDGLFRFAYRDLGESAGRVRLAHGLAGHREAQWLVRGAEGWFVGEFRAPCVHRMEYRFAVTGEDGHETLICDPSNPFVAEDPFGGKSVAFASGYAEPREIAEPSSKGALVEFTLEGSSAGPWRSWLWTLDDDLMNVELPLVVFLDGGDYLRFAKLRNILANLIANGGLPRCRAAFVCPNARNVEYAANPDTPLNLIGQLESTLSQQFPWPGDPARRIGVGASLGGLCMLHAHVCVPHFFGGLVLQSGSFFRTKTDGMETSFEFFDRVCGFVEGIDQGITTVPRIPIQMTCGRGGENLSNNRLMAASLDREGFPVRLTEWPDAHNWTSWRDCVGQALVHALQASR